MGGCGLGTKEERQVLHASDVDGVCMEVWTGVWDMDCIGVRCGVGSNIGTTQDGRNVKHS